MVNGFYAADTQVHSFRSHDGRASIRDQCLQAVEIGLDEIGFSEHKDFDPADPAVDYFVYESYAREVAAAREEFAGALIVRMGVEVDFQRWFEDEIARFTREFPFDYVIGSVHYIDSKMLMTDEHVRGRPEAEVYREYYAAVRDSVLSGTIDIVGHLEYAKRRGVPRFGRFDPAHYRDQVAELFDRMIEARVALEVNTAGLRQGTGGMYPCADHLRLYRDRGGCLLTFGSDGHHPDDLGDRFADALQEAATIGFEEVTLYSNRSPSQRPLHPGV